MSRCAPIATVGLVAALVLAVPVASVPAIPVAHAAAVPLRLADQTFNGTVGDRLRFDLVPVDAAPTSIVTISIREPVATADEVREVLDGAVTAEEAAIGVPVGLLPATPSGAWRVEVPTDAAGQDGLEVTPGLHPVLISAERADGSVTDLTTFVDLREDPAALGTLAVGLVADVSGLPTLQPDGSTVVDDAVRDRLTRLAALVEATGQPFSIGVGPELLAGLERTGEADDAALLARLEAGLQDRELLADPYVSFDPSGASRADLGEVYTQQLRLGEDTVAGVLPRQVAKRSVFLARTPIDPGGASLVRDLGARTLVLLPAAQAAIDYATSIGEMYPTLLVDVTLADDGQLPAIVVNDDLSRRLGSPGDDPVLAAYQLMAELVAMREDVVVGLQSEQDLSPEEVTRALEGRALVLATPTGDVPDPTMASKLLDLVADTPGFQVTTASVAGATMDPLVIDGTQAELPLPAEAGPDLVSLAATLLGLSADTVSTASMLPEDDPRPASWAALSDVLVSNVLSDADRGRYVSTIQDEVAEIRDSVVLPAPTRFTLGGRNSSIRIKLGNDADVPLQVTVRMRSAKLTFPDGDQTVELAPEAVTEVEVPVEARSNGSFPVVLDVLTPDGQVPLAPPVRMTARVNALAGLGQVATVGAILVLLTWWVHHLRVKRRERRAGEAGSASRRHPAAGDSSSVLRP